MVLSSWQSHSESSSGSFDECRLSAAVAANPQTKPTDLDCESARKKWQLPSTSTIAILLLLSPRADTHFTVPRRVEGWVDLGTAVWVFRRCPRMDMSMSNLLSSLNSYCKIMTKNCSLKATQGNHAMHNLLSSPKSTCCNLRTLGHGLSVNPVKSKLHKNTFINNRLIFDDCYWFCLCLLCLYCVSLSLYGV